MSNLISATEKTTIIGIAGDVFDTWARNITIHKEPLKIENTSPVDNGLFGFGVNQQTDIYTFEPVTGIYPALIRRGGSYQSSSDITLHPELDANINTTNIAIKVKRDCRDFILNGNNQKIEVDGLVYDINSSDKPQRTFGTDYYIFELKEKK